MDINEAREELVLTLEEAKQDLEEFGDIGIGALSLKGYVFDYELSKPKLIDRDDLENPEFLATQIEPERSQGTAVEPMRLSEFIPLLQKTIDNLADVWNMEV